MMTQIFHNTWFWMDLVTRQSQEERVSMHPGVIALSIFDLLVAKESGLRSLDI